jgi:phosphoribosylaminoimidazole carboxylase (NCAIR synthetase)
MGLTTLGQDFRSYRDAHKGETVWVLGSGATLAHVDASFFDNKICVCVNYSGTTKGLRQFYTVSNHHDDAAAIADARPDLPVVTSLVEQVPDDYLTNLELAQPNIVKVPHS